MKASTQNRDFSRRQKVASLETCLAESPDKAVRRPGLEYAVHLIAIAGRHSRLYTMDIAVSIRTSRRPSRSVAVLCMAAVVLVAVVPSLAASTT